MRKSLIILAALSLGLVACNKETENPHSEGSRLVKITATREAPVGGEQTKTTISDDGAFAWTAADKIKVYTANASFEEMTLEGDGGSATGNFTGTLSGTISTVAVFPASLNPSLSDNTLTLTLPSEIAWVSGEADNLMVAKGFENGASSVSFKNIGGLIKVTLKNVPASANKVTFTAGKTISGTFTCDISEENPVITAGTDSDADANGVTFTFATAADARDMVFYVPVPTGTYSKIGFKVKNDDTVLTSFQGSSSNEISRGRLLIMPELTITTISGGGEGSSTLSMEVPANYNGTYTLPKTSSSVSVKLNETTNAVTLEYAAGAADSEKPENVFLTVAESATINTLNINLSASHVELAGTGTVSNVSSYTNVSTLVVANTVTLGAVTVNKGSLEVSGTVTSITVPSEAETEDIKVDIKAGASVGTVTIEKGSAEIESGAKVNKIKAAEGTSVLVAADVTTVDGTNAPDTSESATGVITTNNVKMVIGDETTYHANVKAAIETANSNAATIDLIADVEETGNIAFSGGENITINLNGHKLTANGNSEWNDARGFKFSDFSSDINLTINGTTENSQVAFGTVRTGFHILEGSNDAQVNLTLNGGTYNLGDKPWYGIIQKTAGTVTISNVTFNSTFEGTIQGFSGTYSGSIIMMERGTLTMSNSTIDAKVCGGVYIAGKGEEYDGDAAKCSDSFTWTATGTLTDCTISNTAIPEKYSWQSSSLAVAFGNTLTVNDGTYTSSKASAYVFSSGGTINLNSGTYKGKLKADYDTGYNVEGNNVKHSYINYSSSCDIADATTNIEAQNANCTIQCVVNDASALSSAIANTKVDKVTLGADVSVNDKIALTGGRNLTIDLNGHTLTVNGVSEFGAADNRGFYIDKPTSDVNLTIKGTTENSKLAFGAVRSGFWMAPASADSDVKVNLTLDGGTYDMGNSLWYGIIQDTPGTVTIQNATITSGYNSGPGSIVKIDRGTLEMKNTTIATQTLGGVYIAGRLEYDNTNAYGWTATGTLTDCSIDVQTATPPASYSWQSAALAASCGNTLTVNGTGTYRSAKASAYVFSSGGTINLKGGTYVGDFKADADRSTYSTAESSIYYSSSCDISDVTSQTAQNEHCKIEQKSF